MLFSQYIEDLKLDAREIASIIDTKKIITDTTKKIINRDDLIVDPILSNIINSDYLFILASHDDAQKESLRLAQSLIDWDTKNGECLFKPVIFSAKLSGVEYVIDANGQRLVNHIHINQIFDIHIGLLSYACHQLYKPKGLIEYEYKDRVVQFLKSEVTKLKLEDKSNLSNDIRDTFINNLKDQLPDAEPIDMVCVLDTEGQRYSACDVIYSNTISKDLFIDTCRSVYNTIKVNKKSIATDYNFKFQVTHSVDAPGDFRLKKYIIFLEQKTKNKKGKQDKIYLFNVYGSATYELVPCYKINKQKYLSAHPFVSIRFKLLSLASIYSIWLKQNNPYMKRLASAYVGDIMSQFKKINTDYETNEIFWFGYYKDEDYDKIKYNQHHRHEGDQHKILT